MIKTQVLVKRKSGMTREDFADYWMAVHTPIVAGIPGIVRQTVSIVRSDLQRSDTPWDGLANAWWESVDALENARKHDAFEAMLEDEQHFVDVNARMPLIVEEVNPLTPQQPPWSDPDLIKIVNPLHKRADLSDSNFSAYWRGPHAEVSIRIPHMRGYVQNDIHPDFRHIPRACDGIAESWFASWDDILDVTQSDAFARVQEDEPNLIAPDSLLPMVCREYQTIARD